MNDFNNDEDMMKNLNPQQQQAILHDKGPLLILAGAGSGKTRVITHRIAYLVKTRGVSPYRILAITFTNKAAKEMKNRIEELIGQDVNNMWVGTFHAMLVKILRKHIDLLGFDKVFTIIDSDDQLKVIKQCIAELNLDDKMFQPRSVHAQISSAKNSLIGVDEFSVQAGRDFRLSAVAKVYDLYQKKLKQNGVLDFDDILYYAVLILQQNPNILDFYQRKFEYILVDEYQDTNHAQYTLIKLLAARHHNLCVVGDDDQSIYSFRGANIQNILDFEKDFKNCEVIKLEQNYRSTGNVLDAANSLIAHNKARKNKKLWTCAEAGEPITFMRTENQNDEAGSVASEISRIVTKAKCSSYKEIAILYRLNALSRNFEGALGNQGIPFKIYGGMRFFDRKEIKDLLAYLRLIIKGDNLSFERIINIPRRGIGDVTIETIAFIAAEHEIQYLDVCAIAKDEPRLSRIWPKLLEFYELIRRFREEISLNKLSLPEFFEYVQNESGIVQEIIDQREKNNEITDRVENLKELLSDAVEFEKQFEPANMVVTFNPSESEPGEYEEAVETPKDLYGKLTAYLENIALYTEQDQEILGDDFVKLMTIHSAKGLEFDYIFLVGAEESLFPGSRSIQSGREEDLEEERRLAYVAITRARKKLIITTAKSRMLYGKTECYPVSRFVKEIPEKYIEEIGGSRFESSFGSRDFGSSRDFGAAKEKRPGGEKKPVLSDDSKKDHFFDFSSLMGSKNSSVNKGAANETGGKMYLKADEVKVGDEVVHDKFGPGKILNKLPVANDAILEIRFNDFGVKKMLMNQAKLSKSAKS
ncbi:MAG: ATP-dependent helicase [Saccharofermentanales bacterium]